MVAAVVLVGLVLVAAFSGPYGIRGAILLAAVSVLWLVVNSPMEGAVLLRLTGANGLTAGDLAGLAGLAVAGYRIYLGRRSPLGGLGRRLTGRSRWPGGRRR